VVALWHWLFGKRNSEDGFPFPDRTYHYFWIAAWILCVIHVICAFHFRHHWVHDAAIQHTAEMTERIVGIRWGGGLYVNYVFLICWGASAIPSLFGYGGHAQSQRWLETGLHAFAAFMMFNATAIFGPPWWWIPTIVVIAAIVFRWASGRQLADEATSPDSTAE
jgi:hypothetical protein